jgi:hypothetical protein
MCFKIKGSLLEIRDFEHGIRSLNLLSKYFDLNYLNTLIFVTGMLYFEAFL